jgi:hypothetical protein
MTSNEEINKIETLITDFSKKQLELRKEYKVFILSKNSELMEVDRILNNNEILNKSEYINMYRKLLNW